MKWRWATYAFIAGLMAAYGIWATLVDQAGCHYCQWEGGMRGELDYIRAGRDALILTLILALPLMVLDLLVAKATTFWMRGRANRER